MSRMKGIVGAAVLVLLFLFLFLAMWFGRRQDEAPISAEMSKAGSRPDFKPLPVRKRRVTLQRVSEPVETGSKGSEVPADPKQSVHRCPAPESVPEGRHRVGKKTQVLVRGGATTALAPDDAGAGIVVMGGAPVGRLSWKAGACSWSPVPTVLLEGQIAGGGVHTITGCPVGEVTETDEDGRFSVEVPLGPPCWVYTIGYDGELVYLSKKIQIDTSEDAIVELQPAEALDPGFFEKGAVMLTKLTLMRIETLKTEQNRWKEVDSELARWTVDQIAQEIEFFEAELARVDDPEQSHDVVLELLYGGLN